ncbi:hypothetical protein DRQ53_08610 [bacterium]|nr:MAG: hypothetical protein DRQ53_08610 [bacterium]
MSNMSYCRFENTSGDLSDCLGAMRDMEKRNGVWGQVHYDEDGSYFEAMNDYEAPSVDRMAKLCEEFLDEYANKA